MQNCLNWQRFRNTWSRKRIPCYNLTCRLWKKNATTKSTMTSAMPSPHTISTKESTLIPPLDKETTKDLCSDKHTTAAIN